MQEMLLLASMIAGSTVWIMTKLAKIDGCISVMKRERWTVIDMRHYNSEAKKTNPTMKLPSVDAILDQRREP